ncbi:MAG: prepilin-type N-terminal cleavage/methylation domain-containing protein [Lentisphaerae bacterium]|nr:prepilin-type N-terminal cleavage/methylation domain-containing protein [Lentisphaerota bacterium]
MKRFRFTLIELLVVIAIIAIPSSSKCSFFLLFSAI